MNTLTISAAPLTTNTATLSGKLVLAPNRIMHTPNSATTLNNVRPARSIGFRCASAKLIPTAPILGAARNSPNPLGPTCRISAANTGNNATAPPNNTENKSRVNAPSRIRSLNTKRTPALRLSAISSV